jgi:hypothetical protein
MAGGGGRALDKTVGAPDEEHEAKNDSENGQCHTVPVFIFMLEFGVSASK